MSEQEFLERYGKVPLTPEGVASIIDDRNNRSGVADRTDYAQEYSRSISDGATTLLIIQTLDDGDVSRAKRMLMTQLNVDVAFLPVYRVRGHPGEAEQAAAGRLCSNYLAYLYTHTNEIDLRRVDIRNCFRGMIGELVDSPEQTRKVMDLVESVRTTNAQGSAAEPVGGGNDAQPVSLRKAP